MQLPDWFDFGICWFSFVTCSRCKKRIGIYLSPEIGKTYYVGIDIWFPWESCDKHGLDRTNPFIEFHLHRTKPSSWLKLYIKNRWLSIWVSYEKLES